MRLAPENGGLKSWKVVDTGNETLSSPSGAKVGSFLYIWMHLPPGATFFVRSADGERERTRLRGTRVPLYCLFAAVSGLMKKKSYQPNVKKKKRTPFLLGLSEKSQWYT